MAETVIVTRDGLILGAGRIVADYRSWGAAVPAMVQSTVAELRRAGVEVIDRRSAGQRRDAFAGLDIEAAGDLAGGARTVA